MSCKREEAFRCASRSHRILLDGSRKRRNCTVSSLNATEPHWDDPSVNRSKSISYGNDLREHCILYKTTGTASPASREPCLPAQKPSSINRSSSCKRCQRSSLLKLNNRITRTHHCQSKSEFARSSVDSQRIAPEIARGPPRR